MPANSVSSAVDSIKPSARGRAPGKKVAATPRGRAAVQADRPVATKNASKAPPTPAPETKASPAASGEASEGAKAKRKYTRKASSTPRAPRVASGFNTGTVRKELNAQKAAANKALKDQAKAYKADGKALNAELSSVSKRMEQLEKTNDRITKGAQAALAQADRLLEALD